MRAAPILLVVLTACAPALRPELRPASVSELSPATSWERMLGDPSWWWPYGFDGRALTEHPRLDLIEARPAPIELGPEPGRSELLQHYRPTRAWRPIRSLASL